MIKVAVLVDGGFFRKHMVKACGQLTAQDAASLLYRYCRQHINKGSNEECSLYRVLYYDCAPSTKRVYHPLLKKVIDLGKEPMYQWSTDFLQELRSKRKFAVRLGLLAEEQANYVLKPDITKKLMSGVLQVSDLTERDFALNMKQKGVDTRIGIDIVSMSLKKQVDRIVLIAGDSDFVPAAKYARREGIDFVLDSMGAPIKPNLSEHIDGLKYFDIKRCLSTPTSPHA